MGSRWFSVIFLMGMVILGSPGKVYAKTIANQIPHLTVPILGTSFNQQRQPIGLVSKIEIEIQKRQDQHGLQIQFHTEPGQFSLLARKSIHQAITRALRAANLSSESWTILLMFPYKGLTMYGESLSAMVGLSVVAMAKGEPLLEGRTLTGTITDEGTIGSVSGVQLKILAAYHEHFQRVLVPGVYDEREGDWRIPFLMHVSPVSTIEEAYQGLTGYQLTTR